jgi:hypothetical protein
MRSGPASSTARNIYDQAAAPLKPGLPGRRRYPDYKAARGLQPIRDWTWSGHTLRGLKVLTANENRAAIGFLDESLPGRRLTASQIAAFNNRREAQWGVSPRDRQAVLAALRPCCRHQDSLPILRFLLLRVLRLGSQIPISRRHAI